MPCSPYILTTAVNSCSRRGGRNGYKFLNQAMSGGISADGSRIIDHAEEDNSLDRRRKDLLLQIYKAELVLNILKNVDAKDLNVSDKERFQKMIRTLSIQNYIRLSETDNVLGLETVDSLPFTYSERKVLREYLFVKIQEICTPVVEYVGEIEKKIPNVFQVDGNATEILQLEEKRKKLTNDLIKLKSNKVELLRACTEMKLAPHEKNSLELLLAEYKLNHMKIDTLQEFLLQEFCTSTEFTMKAIKDVERYLDEELKKLEES